MALINAVLITDSHDARRADTALCFGKNNCVGHCFDGAFVCNEAPTSGGPWAEIYTPGVGWGWQNVGGMSKKPSGKHTAAAKKRFRPKPPVVT